LERDSRPIERAGQRAIKIKMPSLQVDLLERVAYRMVEGGLDPFTALVKTRKFLITLGLLLVSAPWIVHLTLRSPLEIRLAAVVMGLVNLVAGLTLLPWLLKAREFNTTRAHADAWVLDAISELKSRLGIGKELRIWVIESRYPCAMLVWSELVLCRGLFELFNDEKRVVEAVIAHELTHYKNLKFVVVKQAIAMTALFNLGVLVSTTLKLLEDSQLLPDLLVSWLVLLTSTALALLIPPSLSRVEELLADVQASLLLKDHRPLLAYFNRVEALHPQVIEVRATWKILTLPLILTTMLLVDLVVGYFNSHPPTGRVEWLVTTAVLTQQRALN